MIFIIIIIRSNFFIIAQVLITLALPQNKKNDEKGNKDEQEKEKNEPQEEKNDQKNSENSDNEALEEKLKKINMSKKKAEMILNALNNNEFQYIQQLKRKPNKKKDSTKPDW